MLCHCCEEAGVVSVNGDRHYAPFSREVLIVDNPSCFKPSQVSLLYMLEVNFEVGVHEGSLIAPRCRAALSFRSHRAPSAHVEMQLQPAPFQIADFVF